MIESFLLKVILRYVNTLNFISLTVEMLLRLIYLRNHLPAVIEDNLARSIFAAFGCIPRYRASCYGAFVVAGYS